MFGSLIHFNTEGLDFVMTAMFAVIFIEQWTKEKRHAGAHSWDWERLLCACLYLDPIVL